MQYSLVDLLSEDDICLGLSAPDALSAIRALNDNLVRTGHTTAEFGEDACEREKVFPTGLPTQPVAVALPHADPDHVLRSAVAVATLQSPVTFAQMGTDGSLHLDVHAVFLLAIREREKQVSMIQQLMKLIQDGDVLSELMRAAEVHDAMELIREALQA